MKVLRRRREVTDLNIVFGASLQEALEAPAGMLATLTLVAVRQKQNDPAVPLPFRFCRDDELVDDGLGTVSKIPKLRFPKAKHVRIIERVAVIETEYGSFRKKTIVNANSRLLLRQMHERNVRVARFGIIKNGMPSAESSARTVLAR